MNGSEYEFAWPGAGRRERDDAQAALVVHLVSAATGVAATDIAAVERSGAAAARARQIAMYLAHTGLAWTLARVAQAFARDRSTVSHAVRRVEDWREDVGFDRGVGAIERCLQQLPTEGTRL